MARNLFRAGHEVALWSNTSAKAKELAAAEKGVFCETPKEVGAAADCLFLCVGDTKMSRKVLLGKDGVAEGAKAGTVIAEVQPGYTQGDRLLRAAMVVVARGKSGGAVNGESSDGPAN